MFKNAIVRTPSQSMINGITSAHLGRPDYAKALMQHQDYIEALYECGLEVLVLDADENFPDSTFVEDVALCTQECAIITNPGAVTRNQEIHSIIPPLKKHYQQIEFIKAPGTVEAGDIMMVGEHFFIGLSERTNLQGAEQMITILNKYDYTSSMVTMKNFLHLKTGVNYLENNNILASGEFIEKAEFTPFNLSEIPEEEAYATNSVWINGTVLTPTGFPKTRLIIENLGYKVREVDVSEFQKLDGGLSCLSLRF